MAEMELTRGWSSELGELEDLRLKAAKKYLDMTNWKDFVKSKTQDIKDKDERAEAETILNSEIQEHITKCITQAIPTALHIKLVENLTDMIDDTTGDSDGINDLVNVGRMVSQIHIGPFTYGIEPRDSGGTTTIHPFFDSADDTGERWDVDTFQIKPHKNEELTHLIAKYLDDETFLDTTQKFLVGWVYDASKHDWITNSSRFEDLDISLLDIQFLATIHVMTIIYKLATTDSDDGSAEFEIPGEGIYRMEPPKDGKLVVGFIPAKEYKLAIKADAIVEQATDE